ncbi:MAG: response regulator [Gammaproteobacteria bacterium]|nr:response regulator [Gammaproteobacteria bacterium]MDH5735225.1 response regulator [Gammaproteobacteria bacterium]
MDKNKNYITTMTSALRLLVVDDSKLMREAIIGMFADDENVMMEEAADGLEALVLLDKFKPDVVTLDINMPGLDGIGTLKRMMIEHPVPTIMLSSLTQEGAKITFDALRYGAVDFISKPSAMSDISREEQAAQIRGRVKYAAEVELAAIKYIRHESNKDDLGSDVSNGQIQHIVAMGAAEGGYGALLKIIPQLRTDSNSTYLISLHVASEFVDAFIGYLNTCSKIPVKRAVHNDVIKPGCCYISSGTDYMSVHKEADGFSLHISPAPFVTRRGAIDMLLFSTAEAMGDQAVGVILSGLGEDGAEGLEEIIRVGGMAIVQDPHTCFCKEMALSALERSAVEQVVVDAKIPSILNGNLNN